jgi:putative FmdB family regulatory protein
LYEYECDACCKRFERIQKFSDPPVETCPHCGGAVHKLLSSPAIQFKGTGWYITDYAGKKPADGSKGEKSSGSETASGDSTASANTSDSKPAAPAAAAKADS